MPSQSLPLSLPGLLKAFKTKFLAFLHSFKFILQQLYRMQFYPRLILLLLLSSILWAGNSFAQRTITKDNTQPNIQTDGRGNPINPKNNKVDSLKHRDNTEDSITITYRFLDSTRLHRMDSSVNDFNKRYPLPYHYVTSGNYGNAAKSYLFDPILRPGFDVGFHAFDVYRFKLEETKIYQTTRPYTELGYLLGNKAEQTIHAVFTQNKKSNLNYGFEYRFINATGFLKNQNASHNNFRFHTFYNSTNRKYTLYFIFLSNKLKSSENGGVVNETQLKNLAFSDPFEMETRLGNTNTLSRNPFNTSILTGNEYKDNTIFIRHHFDLGKKDSLVTDSTTFKIFYPRIRLQHTFKYTKSSYQFRDTKVDSASYNKYLFYTVDSASIPQVEFFDKWRDIINEFSVISFPQKNNLNQFLKFGAAFQDIRGEYNNSTDKLHNVYALAEYRNRTRNQHWDIEANGVLYLNGFNSGDYSALASLKRSFGKLGYLELSAQNVNRTPSAIFYGKTNFPVKTSPGFKQENYSRLFAVYEIPKQRLRLSANYYVITNYVYFDSFYHARQESTLFNILHVAAEKIFKLSKHVFLHSEVHLQQAAGNPPVNIPLIFTRNRLAYEGNLGFKNLDLATGIEIKYHTPYKSDNYSPLVGQFVFQDSTTISNRPDVSLFLHFRIKSFKGFIRTENLNTLGKNYNFAASHYPRTPFWVRVGIWWSFVN
jgi:hypothetical protein